MKTILMPGLILIIAVLSVLTAGCTGIPGNLTGSQGNAGNIQSGNAVQAPPPEYAVDIQVNEKDPIYKTVDVIFAGGRGQVQVSGIDVTFTDSNGNVVKKSLKPDKGATATFQGTTGTDRAEVFVNYYSGAGYKVT